MANLEITGKLIQIDEPVTGKSSKGEWKKQNFIIETDDQYPKKVCFLSWNDKVKLSGLKPGTSLSVSFNAESREFNGKWYTDLKAWKIDTKTTTSQEDDIPPPPPPMDIDGTNDIPPENYENLDERDLPF